MVGQTYYLFHMANFLKSWEFGALLALVILDEVTGISLAIKNHVLNSSLSYNGIAKKIIALLTPLLIYPILVQFHRFDLNDLICLMVAWPLCLSLIENYTKLGFKIPDAIIKYFDPDKLKKP